MRSTSTTAKSWTKPHRETTLEEIVRVDTAYCVRSPYACVRPAYAPRTPHVRLRMPCMHCSNLDCWNTYKKGSHKNGWSLRLPFSHPCGLIASDPFTDVSVIVSQGESCPGLHPTVNRLAGGPWPSPYWVGGPLKESRASRVQPCTQPSTGSLVVRDPLRPGVEIP